MLVQLQLFLVQLVVLEVVYTDFVLFFAAMAGSIGAAYYLVNLPEVGGMTSLITNENISNKLSILPSFDDPSFYIPLLIIPLWFNGGVHGIPDLSRWRRLHCTENVGC